MAVMDGALPSVIKKLGELLIGEYNLQKGVKGEIRFLQCELESMQGALEKVSNTPIDQLDIQDKIWARNLRELSYDIEDSIDTFMVRGKCNEQVNLHGINKFIDTCVGLFRKAKIRHGITTEIRDLKSRVEEMAKRHPLYELNFSNVAEYVSSDPRLLSQYDKVTELVGIEEAIDEVIRILMEGNEVSKQQDKIISIVGFGGLGKTTLADVVYQKLRAQFECGAFVSVSQTPDLEELLKRMFYQLVGRESNKSSDVARALREFLENKRYFVVVDDVWDISIWKMIRYALPDNDVGYTIITTTRIIHVAEQAGGAYYMKPLSLNNSRKLLYRRIFGNGNKDSNEAEEKCHEELAEVSNRILKKCAGVPLAIITMASLLACKARDEMEWYEVYNSVGTGLKNNLEVRNMRKILSFSYYELPYHLRTCLLYLSMFPEDCEIEKDVLIRMWIGEGFIQCENLGKRLFELGESYFNELINRNMIQPLHKSLDGMISRCRVHVMMLDLIRSLSSKENFVTVLSNMGVTSRSNTIRRLSLQNGQESHVMAQATWNLQHVRSVVVFPASVSLVPPLYCYRALRVLDLEDCNLSEANSILKCLGNIHQLRYLGLRRTGISQLPEETGNLQFLQTLDLRCNKICRLSSSVVQLSKLMCLRIDMDTRVPNGIASLTSLEELSQIGIYDPTDIEIIYCLTELRELDISCHIECMDSLEKSLVECLCKLQKIQNLNIIVTSGECKLDGLVLSQKFLRRLSLRGCWFSTLPAWVNPSLLVDLSFISIAVIELKEEDLEILGTLPALCYLNLKVDHENLGIIRRFIIGAFFFRRLVGCVLWGFRGPVVFHQGAMPRLTSLRFTLHARDTREISGSSDGGYDFGFQNLPSLQDVTVLFRCGGTSDEEVKEVKAALRHATTIHPNHPTIDIVGYEDKDE